MKGDTKFSMLSSDTWDVQHDHIGRLRIIMSEVAHMTVAKRFLNVNRLRDSSFECVI
jgi:hypothetical protein